MTPKNRPCRYSRLSASLSTVLVASFAPVPAIANELASAAVVALRPAESLKLSPDGDDTPGSTGNEFYLETVLNLAPTGHLARFVEINGKFFASASTLRELGLRWPGSDSANGLLALDSLPGLHADYDASQQRMLLQVPVEMLAHDPTHFSLPPSEAPRPDPAMQAPGLLLNYDLNTQRSAGLTTTSGFSELRLFGLGPGIWSNTSSHRIADTRTGEQHESVRLDTSWQLDLPDSMVSLTVGDSISGAVSWSRSTRMGGVRIARDFGLQPQRVTTPLASFAGEAALPSSVDLFINGIKQSSQQVTPGQFQIDSIPMLNGAGTAQIVVTDINGVSRTLDFQFYGAQRLLEAGLSDWSIDLGWVRRDYGLDSFSYASSPALVASTRHGLSKRLTLEMHTEIADQLTMAGAGGIWMPTSRSGVFNVSIAASNANAGTITSGSQRSLGYQWSMHGFNVNLSQVRRSQGFRDVASLEGGLLPTHTDQAFVGLSTRFGQWSAGHVRQQYPDSEPSRYLTLGWSKQLPRASSVYLSFSRDQEQKSNSLWLSWSMPLDRRSYVSASVRREQESHNVALQAGRSVDGDQGGWGWRAQASQSQGGRRSGQAQVDWLNEYGAWNAGLADYGSDSNSLWANARGSLLWMAGQTRAMRYIDNAFAMVSTQGVADVPVRLENRLVGHTDTDGLLFIDRLNPWQTNKLGIDPLDLPADMRIETTELHAVPAGRSGVLAHFPLRRILSLEVGVVDATGKPLPAGSPVWSSGADMASEAPMTVIGHDSLIYLQDPPARLRLSVRTPTGTCEIMLPEVTPASGFAELQGIVCR